MQHPIPAARTGSSGWVSPAAVTLLRSCLTQPDAVSDDVLSKAVRACSAEELATLGLAPPPAPALALGSSTSIAQLTMGERLVVVQGVISALQYKLSPGYNFDASKRRPLHAILTTAVGMLLHPLPIKCIEAVFLGLLLTQGWQLQRLPLGFKSRGSDGAVHRHIVLAIADCSSGGGGSTPAWGALGISRCAVLMDKPLQPGSLAGLVEGYAQAYRHVQHELVKVRVGLPVEHDPAWAGPVCWRFCTVSRVSERPWAEVAEALHQHAAQCAELQARFRRAVGEGGTTAGGGGSSPRRCGGGQHATVVVGGPTTPRSPRRGLQQPHQGVAPPSPRRRCVPHENEAGSGGNGNGAGDDDEDASDAEASALVASLAAHA